MLMLHISKLLAVEELDSSTLGVGCWFVSTFVLIGMLTVFNDLSGQLLFWL